MVQARRLISPLAVSNREAGGGKHELLEDPVAHGHSAPKPGPSASAGMEASVAKTSPPAKAASLTQAGQHVKMPQVTKAAGGVQRSAPLSAAEFFEQQVASLAPTFVQMGSDESRGAARESIADSAADSRGSGAVLPADDLPNGSGMVQSGELRKQWQRWLQGVVPHALVLTWVLLLPATLLVGMKVFFIIRERMRLAQQERAVKLWVPKMGEAADMPDDAAARMESAASPETSEAEPVCSDDDETTSDVLEDWEIETAKLSPRFSCEIETVKETVKVAPSDSPYWQPSSGGQIPTLPANYYACGAPLDGKFKAMAC